MIFVHIGVACVFLFISLDVTAVHILNLVGLTPTIYLLVNLYILTVPLVSEVNRYLSCAHAGVLGCSTLNFSIPVSHIDI